MMLLMCAHNWRQNERTFFSGLCFRFIDFSSNGRAHISRAWLHRRSFLRSADCFQIQNTFAGISFGFLAKLSHEVVCNYDLSQSGISNLFSGNVGLGTRFAWSKLQTFIRHWPKTLKFLTFYDLQIKLHVNLCDNNRTRDSRASTWNLVRSLSFSGEIMRARKISFSRFCRFFGKIEMLNYCCYLLWLLCMLFLFCWDHAISDHRNKAKKINLFAYRKRKDKRLRVETAHGSVGWCQSDIDKWTFRNAMT